MSTRSVSACPEAAVPPKEIIKPAMTLEPGVEVTEADLERELTMIRSRAANDSAGIFGPASVIWRINRETAIFLAAGRALLLQLAHPWVAAAIDQHSRTLADPIGRFHRTFNLVFTMVFGTTSQALAASRRLHRRHSEIGGTLIGSSGRFAAGSTYRANNVAALRWVHGTLTDSAVVAYQLLHPPISLDDQERCYAEYLQFAALFGLPRAALPANWTGFAEYIDMMVGSDILTASDAARAIAADLFSGTRTHLRVPSWYRALTARLLPPRLRDEFRLPYGQPEHRSAERALTVLRFAYPLIPARLRFVPPYHEACARLAGCERPGLLTQILNRCWIGQRWMAIGGE
jgi:uncharacterized protein (DUF2236 family)